MSRKIKFLIRLIAGTFVMAVSVSNSAAAVYDVNYYQTNLVSGTPIREGNKWLASGDQFSDFEIEQWPDAAMWCIRHMRHNLSNGDFHGYDGVSGEGGNYHFFGLGNSLVRAQKLIGYTIPTGYTFPAINEFQGSLPPKGVPLTLDDILPRWVKSNQFVQNAMFLANPDGRDCGIHDSGSTAATDPTDPWEWRNTGWSGAGLDPRPWENDRLAHNYLLGAFGQIGLGGGPLSGGTNQTQAMLHFSKRNGHAAADTMAIALFGRGKTLFGYTGYFGGTAATTGSWHGPHNKNMPIINNTWQNKYLEAGGWHDCHGHVEICAWMPGVQVARVDGSHIYHGGSYSLNHGELLPNRYRRTLMLNTVDADRAYLVDLCELDGGSTHDYVLGGSVTRTNSVPYSDLSLTQSTSFPYVVRGGWTGYDLNKLSSGSYATNSSFYVDTGFAANTNLGARIHIPSQGEAGSLYLGWINDPFFYSTETPKWGPNGDNGRWHMTLHREGTGIKSTFVVVHEVKDGSGTSFIQSIDRTPIGTDTVAITVTLTDGRQDTYLVSFDGQKTMSHNGVNANATIAVSSRSGTLSDLWMVNGSSVSDTNKSLSATTGEITGDITKVNRTLFRTGTSDSFETDAVFPVGKELRGQTLIVELIENNLVKVVNSYTIETVEALASGSRIHLRTDPGLILTGTSVEEAQYPRRTATSARLRFIPQATTVPQIVAMDPDPEEWKRLKVRKSVSAGALGEITLTTLPALADVRCHIGASNVTVNGTLSVNGASTVEFEVPNPGGLTTPRNIKQRYHTSLPALPGSVDASKPGLVARLYTGGWNKSFDPTASFNTYIFGATQVIDGLADGDVTFNADNAGALINGYIDVPATGLYSFYTRFDSGAKLAIDGEVLTSQLGMRSWASWKSTIYLEQGPHAIEVDTMCLNRSYGGHMQLYWEGPGITYQAVPSTSLYQELAQTPYGGTARNINDGARIESEDYDKGGSGVAYYDTTAGNTGGKYRSDDVDIDDCDEGGYNVGWVDSGEWLEYTVNVTPGIYDINIRAAVSSSTSSQIEILLDGNSLGTKTLAVTGAWQTYADNILSSVDLNSYSGTLVLRVYAQTGLANWNYIEFTRITSNTAPVALADSVSVAEDGSVAIALTGSDADSDPLTYTVETQPANGVLSGTAPNLTYTPNADYNGSDSFTFTVNDGTTNSAVATVAITVAAMPEEFPVGSGTGGIRRDRWNNISGSSLSDLSGLGSYPDASDANDVLATIDYTTLGDNYGILLRGYLHAPVTGEYTFYIASDDASELRISSDTEPTNAVAVVGLTSWTTQYNYTTSAQAMSLIAGQKYYIEVLHKEGGGDYLAVAWSAPGYSQAIIEGQYLSPLDSDGDGLTDAQEVALGTNPNNPDSGLGIDGTPLPTLGKFKIMWPSSTGVLYRVWKSPDLSGWTVARDWTNAVDTPEDSLEFDLSPTNGFFKVEAEIQ